MLNSSWDSWYETNLELLTQTIIFNMMQLYVTWKLLFAFYFVQNMMKSRDILKNTDFEAKLDLLTPILGKLEILPKTWLRQVLVFMDAKNQKKTNEPIRENVITNRVLTRLHRNLLTSLSSCLIVKNLRKIDKN